MKKILSISLLTVAAACMPAAPVGLSAVEQSSLSGALAGRSEGPSVNCVSQRNLRGNRSFGDGVILFEGAGGMAYLNRPTSGCRGLNNGATLVTRTTGSRLCSGDIVTVLDPVSGTQFGGCSLGEFTPYRRTR